MAISSARFLRFFFPLLLILACVADADPAANPAGILDLGELNGGGESVAFRVSADGSTVVGWARDGASDGAFRAFRWTAKTGMQSLGVLGGNGESFALDVSADGSVIVGFASNDKVKSGPRNGLRAFRWTQATGMQDLGVFPGSKYPQFKQSFGYGVSADGHTVVGYAPGPENGDGYFAFRWTRASGMRILGELSPGSSKPAGMRKGASLAFAISADGQVVVGTGTDHGHGVGHPAFRWSQHTGMKRLTGFNGEARGVSADGRVVVGGSYSGPPGDADNVERAFRWTESEGVQTLGVIRGGSPWSIAYGVSADGAVVVGHAMDGAADNINRAFRWTKASGLQTVEDWLRANGVKVPADITKAAYATNRDGTVVVGQLANGRAFMASLKPRRK